MRLTPKQYEAIRIRIENQANIPSGLGDEENACTVGAINLVLIGKLTAERPDCMSPALHAFIMPLQDAMPEDMRNSARYRRLVPSLAGSYDPAREQARLDMILDWTWSTVLPLFQPVADANGFGDKWRVMCRERTEAAARVARVAARGATWGARAAARATEATEAAGDAEAARATEATEAAEAAARVVRAVAGGAASRSEWNTMDPIGLLERLVSGGPCAEAKQKEAK